MLRRRFVQVVAVMRPAGTGVCHLRSELYRSQLPDIGEKERSVLRLEKAEDAVVCLILVIPKDPMEATANLLGPLVMNTETRLGMQVVVVNPQYSTRYRLFKDPNADPEAPQGGDEDGEGGREEAANAGT